MSASGLKNVRTQGPHTHDLARGGFNGIDADGPDVAAIKAAISRLDTELSVLREVAGLVGKNSFHKYVRIAARGHFNGSREAAAAIIRGDELARRRHELNQQLMRLKDAPNWRAHVIDAVYMLHGADAMREVRALAKELAAGTKTAPRGSR